MTKLVDLCNDELDIVFNFLPLRDLLLIRMINKYIYDFFDKNFKLENYIHTTINKIIINKYAKYLKKIIISNDNNITNNDLRGMDLKY